MKTPDDMLKTGPEEHYLMNEKTAELIQRLTDENRALRTELMTNQKEPGQEAKADAGKPRLTLVPPRIIWDIAAVRQYGVEVKYPKTGVDGWRTIGIERIKDAAFRHFMRYLATPHGVDEESGLPHLWHCCCNLAFLCELEDEPCQNE